MRKLYYRECNITPWHLKFYFSNFLLVRKILKLFNSNYEDIKLFPSILFGNFGVSLKISQNISWQNGEQSYLLSVLISMTILNIQFQKFHFLYYSILCDNTSYVAQNTFKVFCVFLYYVYSIMLIIYVKDDIILHIQYFYYSIFIWIYENTGSILRKEISCIYLI